MTTIEITMPQDSADFLSRLAALLRPEVEYPQAMLLQDALRTYEWVLQQQLDGRVVASIPPGTKAYLEAAQDAPDDAEVFVLVRYIPDGFIKQARAALAVADPAHSAGATEGE